MAFFTYILDFTFKKIQTYIGYLKMRVIKCWTLPFKEMLKMKTDTFVNLKCLLSNFGLYFSGQRMPGRPSQPI
jgi:hypothetical protein